MTPRLLLTATVLALAVPACGPVPINDYVSPTVPAPTAPASMNLAALERLDHRTDLRAEVLTVRGDAVPGATVRFFTSGGTIVPAVVATDVHGYATATITAQNKVFISITVDGCAACSINTEFIGPPTLPLPEMSLEPSCSTSGRVVTCRVSGRAADVGALSLQSVQWTWGDGAYNFAGNGNNLSHTYTAAGPYTISAFGTSTDLRSAIATVGVQIQ